MHTGFKYRAVYDEDTEIEHPYTDVVGMLRRDERSNPWIGNSNMPNENVFFLFFKRIRFSNISTHII